VSATNALLIAAQAGRGGFDPSERPEATVARAEALRRLGADPKLVLTTLLDPAKKAFPKHRAPYQAAGELGLDKHDYQVAAGAFREGLGQFPGDPDLTLGLARALAGSAPGESAKLIEAALAANPRHAGALLFKAETLTGLNEHKQARAALDQARAVNPANPRALAQGAAIAELEGDAIAAADLRGEALAVWGANPEVDHIIGATLARQYRFADGIRFLQQSLAADPNYLPAHFDLGSNLLRFGAEAEGWPHIEAVRQRDPYHVAALNLVTLREQMAAFKTAEAGGVRVRMAPLDMTVFGQRALDLSARAKQALSAKYQTAIPFPVTVEIFPEQQDFAVRTFQMPGGEGFLGVCFGPLITACSPRGRLGRANWEAVLWHEMGHTITLTATRHRIPRWLSEGISVYEERLANPGWGQWMNSERRRAIEAGGFAPIASLDALFRKNIDLAYFESSLVVRFLVGRFGDGALQKILADLAKDVPINTALAAHTGPLADLEAGFAAYATAAAAKYGPGIDWKPLDDGEFDALTRDPGVWIARHPARYQAVMIHARKLAEANRWREVRALLDPLLALEPDNREPDSPYLLAAQACRALGDDAAERAALEKLAALDGGSDAARARLMEIAAASGDDALLASSAGGLLAINPFHAAALRAQAGLAAKAGQYPQAARLYQALLATDPPDAARLRFERARVLHRAGDPAARRELLIVLEDNSRFREALALLVEMHNSPAPPAQP